MTSTGSPPRQPYITPCSTPNTHHNHHQQQHEFRNQSLSASPESASAQLASRDSVCSSDDDTAAGGASPNMIASGAGPAVKKANRSKFHVTRACGNCKKAHLGCDVQRPCKRCISLGKQDSCFDTSHKKRGRPRLVDTIRPLIAPPSPTSVVYSISPNSPYRSSSASQQQQFYTSSVSSSQNISLNSSSNNPFVYGINQQILKQQQHQSQRSASYVSPISRPNSSTGKINTSSSFNMYSMGNLKQRPHAISAPSRLPMMNIATESNNSPATTSVRQVRVNSFDSGNPIDATTSSNSGVSGLVVTTPTTSSYSPVMKSMITTTYHQPTQYYQRMVSNVPLSSSSSPTTSSSSAVAPKNVSTSGGFNMSDLLK